MGAPLSGQQDSRGLSRRKPTSRGMQTILNELSALGKNSAAEFGGAGGTDPYILGQVFSGLHQ
jgi:hypothetical protein